MKHGMHCDCLMCTMGKKMGMIRNKDHHEHDHNHHHDDHECENCHHMHREDGLCDCGCKIN